MKRYLGLFAVGIFSTLFFIGCAKDANTDSRKFAKHESEIIKSASYDKMAQKLTLVMTDGKTNSFNQVPSALATELMSGANAPDKIFNQKIKGKFTTN